MLNQDDVIAILRNNKQGKKYSKDEALELYLLLKAISEEQVKKYFNQKTKK
jgi:hypothetical protein